MKYTFTIPGRLPGLNEYTKAERTNRYQGAKLKKDCEKTVSIFARAGLKYLRINRKVNMTYTWAEKDRRRDKDNVSAFGRKVIQDTLVKLGVLKNDGWDEIGTITDIFTVDKEHPHITVELEEISQ